METKPFISVIIPCYNVEDYIEECLDSVFNQTYRNFEVIVVDNNCTDRTIKMVEQYMSDKKVDIIVVQETNQGASCARNKGLLFSTGSWIQFLDADDLLLPEKLEHQVGLIDDQTDIIASATIERNTDGSEFIMTPHENIIFGLMAGYRYVGSTCSNLWRKASLDRINGFDVQQKSSQEIDMMFRLYKSGYNFLKDDVPLAVIRKRVSGQMSRGDQVELSKNWLRLRCKQLSFFKDDLFSVLAPYHRVELFNYCLIRLSYQAENYLQLSHDQFHEVVWPTFKKSYFKLDLRRQLIVFIYLVLGFSKGRVLINRFK